MTFDEKRSPSSPGLLAADIPPAEYGLLCSRFYEKTEYLLELSSNIKERLEVGLSAMLQQTELQFPNYFLVSQINVSKNRIQSVRIQ